MSDAILQAGLQGVQGGLDQFGRASSQIASSFGNTTANNSAAAGTNSIVDNVVEVKQAEHSVEASAKVISTADSTLGSLLDERA